MMGASTDDTMTGGSAELAQRLRSQFAVIDTLRANINTARAEISRLRAEMVNKNKSTPRRSASPMSVDTPQPPGSKGYVGFMRLPSPTAPPLSPDASPRRAAAAAAAAQAAAQGQGATVTVLPPPGSLPPQSFGSVLNSPPHAALPTVPPVMQPQPQPHQRPRVPRLMLPVPSLQQQQQQQQQEDTSMLFPPQQPQPQISPREQAAASAAASQFSSPMHAAAAANAAVAFERHLALLAFQQSMGLPPAQFPMAQSSTGSQPPSPAASPRYPDQFSFGRAPGPDRSHSVNIPERLAFQPYARTSPRALLPTPGQLFGDAAAFGGQQQPQHQFGGIDLGAVATAAAAASLVSPSQSPAIQQTPRQEAASMQASASVVPRSLQNLLV